MSRVPLKSVCALSMIAMAITGCRSTHSLSKQDYRPEVSEDQFSDKVVHRSIVGSAVVDTPTLEDAAGDAGNKEDSASIHLVAAESGSFTSDQVVPVAMMTEETLSQAVPVWSLSDLEAIALQQNPAIRQASASASKATGFRKQVGLKPNPIVGYQGTQLADEGTDQHAAFVEQEFVRGDKLRKNERVLNQEIQSQLWEVETQRVRVITDLRLRYYEALAAQKRLQLANEFEVVAQKGVEVAIARVNAKEGTRPEVLQAEIQLKQIQLSKRQSEAAFQGAWRQLMAVAGMPGESRGTLDGTLETQSADLDWAAVEQRILSSSP